jgi:hypothetical protein
MRAGGVPVIALTSHKATNEGAEFCFTNLMAPWLAPIIVLFLLVNLFGQRATTPWLLTLPLVALVLKSVWIFKYEGPRVEHQWRLFGWSLWTQSYPLEAADKASSDLIEDTWYRFNRPRWYGLTLTLSSRLKDRVLMRSTNPQELDRVVQMLNATIKDICAKAAS